MYYLIIEGEDYGCYGKDESLFNLLERKANIIQEALDNQEYVEIEYVDIEDEAFNDSLWAY